MVKAAERPPVRAGDLRLLSPMYGRDFLYVVVGSAGTGFSAGSLTVCSFELNHGGSSAASVRCHWPPWLVEADMLLSEGDGEVLFDDG